MVHTEKYIHINIVTRFDNNIQIYVKINKTKWFCMQNIMLNKLTINFPIYDYLGKWLIFIIYGDIIRIHFTLSIHIPFPMFYKTYNNKTAFSIFLL